MVKQLFFSQSLLMTCIVLTSAVHMKGDRNSCVKKEKKKLSEVGVNTSYTNVQTPSRSDVREV